MKKREKGLEVKLLNEMPKLNLYEERILFATRTCQTITDIKFFADAFGVVDLEEFMEVVISCK